jgi:cytoskeleton protein RodZ
MVGTLHPRTAMDVGTTLRIARERRGLTIAQLASTTKIPATVLQAIDDNAFDRVPGGIFVRGFIRTYAREVGLDPRTYAREVGLDPEEMVAQFRAETAEVAPAAAGVDATGVEAIDEEIGHLPIDPDLSGSRPGWGYALIVAALIVGVVSFNRSNAAEPRSASPVAAEAPIESDAVDASAVEPNAIATSGGGLHFEIHARAECWVRAVADGKTVLERLLLPGERVTADAQHDLVLRVGDPAALTYSINGRPGSALGAAGMPVTVRFTSDGRRDPPIS